MRRLLAAILLLLSTAAAQTGYSRGARELGFWAQGGHGFHLVSDTGLFSAGVRVGWVIFSPHGAGSLEYAADFIPINVIAQSTGATYGAGINPVVLKWNFAHAGHVVPYCEIAGGLLVARDNVPPGANTVNFMPQGAVGLQVPLGRDRRPRLDFSLRYIHISNAGLSEPNPGIDTLQGRIGLQFLHGRRH